MSVIEKEIQLRERMREKARQQENHIRWQNERINALEQSLDKYRGKHAQAEEATQRKNAELKDRADRLREKLDAMRNAAIRAGVWNAVKDELKLARED